MSSLLADLTPAILCNRLVSDIAIFVLKRDVKLQQTNYAIDNIRARVIV